MKNIVCLVGFAGSGKDTVGQHLVDNYGFTSIAFADPLKDCLSAVFGWDRAMLSGRTPESRIWREQVDPWWASRLGIEGFTPRYAMQHIGTDVMRKVFHDDVWIINIEKKLMETSGDVVITDGRFPNEIALLRKLGARIYRVMRGPDPEWMDTAIKACAGDEKSLELLKRLGVHASEWSWAGEALAGVFDNNTNVADLHQKVDAMMERPYDQR